MKVDRCTEMVGRVLLGLPSRLCTDFLGVGEGAVCQVSYCAQSRYKESACPPSFTVSVTRFSRTPRLGHRRLRAHTSYGMGT